MEKEIFDSRTDLKKLIFKISSVKEMSEEKKERFFALFNRYGAVVLEHDQSDNPKDNLIDISKYFGNVVGHDRADEDGITTIANLEGFEGYLGASNTDHPLHTGGVYSDEPPVVILLQCLKQSITGGETILVSSKKIYEYLKEQDPVSLERLKKNGVVTIKRKEAQSSRAIFDENFLGNGRCMFSFRCDDVVRFEIDPAEMIIPIAKIKEFIDRPDNQIRFKLKENQILIADNASVMHARTAFSAKEERCLLRITTDGKATESRYPIIIGF